MCTLHASYCSLFWFYLTWTDRRYIVVSERDNKFINFANWKATKSRRIFLYHSTANSANKKWVIRYFCYFIYFITIRSICVGWNIFYWSFLFTQHNPFNCIQHYLMILIFFSISLVWFAIEFIRLIVCVRPCGLYEQRHWQNYQPNPMWTSCGHCTRFVCCFHICKPNNLLSVRTMSQATEWWTKKKSHIRTVQNPLSATELKVSNRFCSLPLFLFLHIFFFFYFSFFCCSIFDHMFTQRKKNRKNGQNQNDIIYGWLANPGGTQQTIWSRRGQGTFWNFQEQSQTHHRSQWEIRNGRSHLLDGIESICRYASGRTFPRWCIQKVKCFCTIRTSFFDVIGWWFELFKFYYISYSFHFFCYCSSSHVDIDIKYCFVYLIVNDECLFSMHSIHCNKCKQEKINLTK